MFQIFQIFKVIVGLHRGTDDDRGILCDKDNAVDGGIFYDEGNASYEKDIPVPHHYHMIPSLISSTIVLIILQSQLLQL